MPANSRNSKLLLHGVARAAETVLLQDLSIQIIANHNLAALVSEIDELSTEIEALKQFHQVISDTHNQITVVPFRYGSTFENQAGLLDWLKRENTKLTEQLESLEGFTEMSIRVVLEKKESETTRNFNSGKDYLFARARQLSQNEDEVKKYTELFTNHFAAIASRILSEKKENHLSFYFLIRREGVENFRRKFTEIPTEMREKMYLSGAWCPFNFVSGA
jgi:hypothetical protein